MKNPIKTLSFFVIAFFMLCAANLSAQCRPEPEIKTGAFIFEENSSIIVPEMLKSRLSLPEANEENSRSVVQLEEELGGCMSMIFDNENKIIAISIPRTAGIEADVLLRYFENNDEKPDDECDALGCLFEAIKKILKQTS